MSGTPALPNVGGPWASHRQSFRIEVPCNISRRIEVSAGQSRRLTVRCHSLEKDITAGQKPLDLRLSWWPGVPPGPGRTADLPIFSRSFEWIHLKNPVEVFVPGNIVDSDVRVS